MKVRVSFIIVLISLISFMACKGDHKPAPGLSINDTEVFFMMKYMYAITGYTCCEDGSRSDGSITTDHSETLYIVTDGSFQFDMQDNITGFTPGTNDLWIEIRFFNLGQEGFQLGTYALIDDCAGEQTYDNTATVSAQWLNENGSREEYSQHDGEIVVTEKKTSRQLAFDGSMYDHSTTPSRTDVDCGASPTVSIMGSLQDYNSKSIAYEVYASWRNSLR